MKKIKVLLRQHETVRKRVVELGLQDETDVEIIAEVSEVFDVLMTVKNQHVDVVIAADTAEDQGMASHLFAEFPDITLLVLASDGAAYIEQRCQHRRTIQGNVSSHIADLLRFAVHNPCEIQRYQVG